MILGTQDKEFFPADLTEKFRFVKSLGFDCFEIDGGVLRDNPDEVRRAIEQTGLIVSTACGGYGGWIGDFDETKRRQGLEDIKKILKNISLVGGTGVVLPAAWGMFSLRLPPMKPPRSPEEDRRILIESLSELEPAAAESDVKIYLEPLNRYQDHMLNLISDAGDLIREGRLARVDITADFYHMSIEEDDISEALLRFRDKIGHIHIAENHRYQPGTGSVDFKRHLKTLKDMDYKGAVVYEGRVRGDDPLEAYQESIAYIKQYL